MKCFTGIDWRGIGVAVGLVALSPLFAVCAVPIGVSVGALWVDCKRRELAFQRRDMAGLKLARDRFTGKLVLLERVKGGWQESTRLAYGLTADEVFDLFYEELK